MQYLNSPPRIIQSLLWGAIRGNASTVFSIVYQLETKTWRCSLNCRCYRSSTRVPVLRAVDRVCPVLDPVWRTSERRRSSSATAAKDTAIITRTSSAFGWPLSSRGNSSKSPIKRPWRREPSGPELVAAKCVSRTRRPPRARASVLCSLSFYSCFLFVLFRLSFPSFLFLTNDVYKWNVKKKKEK